MWNGDVIDVSLPITVEYTIVETAPNFKGNTASSGSTKPATLDSGAVVNVPMFIETGEKIIVSTADCKYVSRAAEKK
jgi:elongation factor P